MSAKGDSVVEASESSNVLNGRERSTSVVC